MKTPFSLGTTVTLLAFSFASVAKANPELESLRSGWKAARASALSPIDQKYRQALEALKLKFTKAGQLPKAVEVDDEIRLMATDDSAAGAKRVDSRWSWGSGGTLTLLSNGQAKHSGWGKNGSWAKMHNGSVALVSDSGIAFLITFNKDGAGRVKSIEDGNTTTIKPQ